MANDEFDIYFARAKIEENWSKEGVSQRRCSLPVLASSEVLQSRYRRGSSVKNARKKSVPYGPHDYAHAFPSPIMEVTSPENEESSLPGGDENMGDDTGQKKRESRVFIYPSLDIGGEQSNGEDEDEGEEDEENVENNSSSLEQQQDQESDQVCVVRNFKTSSKGIVNRGDSVKKTARRASTATCRFDSEYSLLSSSRKSGLFCPPELSSLDLSGSHKINDGSQLVGFSAGDASILPICSNVVIIGEKGVGKSALIRQLMTSTYMGPLDSPQEQTSSCINLSVKLDGEETNIELHEINAKQTVTMPQNTSAYLVVFAVDSQSSFEGAKVLLERCRSCDLGVAVILVANKTDLARKRVISAHDAKTVCRRLKCKYIELSVTLNHNVDNLLVGTIKQINLNPLRQLTKDVNPTQSKDSLACFPLPKGLTKRFSLKHVGHHSGECENLSVL